MCWYMADQQTGVTGYGTHQCEPPLDTLFMEAVFAVRHHHYLAADLIHVFLANNTLLLLQDSLASDTQHMELLEGLGCGWLQLVWPSTI